MKLFARVRARDRGRLKLGYVRVLLGSTYETFG